MPTLFLSFSRDTGRTDRTNERRPCCQDFFKKHPSPAPPLPTSFVPLSFVSSQRDTRDGDWPTWLIVEIYRDSSSSSDCTLIGIEGEGHMVRGHRRKIDLVLFDWRWKVIFVVIKFSRKEGKENLYSWISSINFYRDCINSMNGNKCPSNSSCLIWNITLLPFMSIVKVIHSWIPG